MTMKKVTLTGEDHSRIVRALKCYREQCYANDDMLEMDEILYILEKIDNSHELHPNNDDKLSRGQINEIDQEIQQAKGTLVAGCKGGECD